MNGYLLKEGQLLDNSSVNLFSSISQTLFKGKHTNTYKFGLMKSLLDCIFMADSDYRISMDVINEVFTKTYWNLVNVNHVPQSPISSQAPASGIEKSIENFSNANSLEKVPFDSLKEDNKNFLLKQCKDVMKKYVFGALWGDTGGHLFGFSKKDDYMWLNEKSFKFLTENKILLDQINYYEWLKMCEAILARAKERVDNLSTVLETITKRANLDYFKKELNGYGRSETCFYCGKHLSDGAPLDHVIPWDFLKQDQLWDFVFACPSCNSSKNDKIPSEKYLQKLIDRNKTLGIESPDILSLVHTALDNGVEVGWEPKNK